MTEEEYGLCQIIPKLHGGARATRKVSSRLVRLFAHACALRVGHLITRPANLQAVDTALRFANGRATKEELHECWLAVRKASSSSPLDPRWSAPLRIALYATSVLEDGLTFTNTMNFVADSLCRAIESDRSGIDARCCDMFRDLFPYDIPPQPDVPPGWAGGDVGLVARAIYEEGRFEDMPILADALEDAGCDRPDLIGHCRKPGLHIRGCWGVDLILGLA